MKKIKTYLTTLAIIAITSSTLIFNSCQKDEQIESILQSKPSTSQINNEKGKVVITITWECWGRLKYDCKRGNGLCGVTITIEYYDKTPKENSANVYADENGKLYAEVFVDEELISLFEKGDTSLYIDKDIYCQASDDKLYIIPMGRYKMNPEMGKFGGYIIPVIVE